MAEQNPFESGEYDIPEQNPFESGEYDIPEQNPFDSDEDDMAEQNQTVGTEVTGEEGIDAEESIGLGGFLRSLSTPAAETPVDTFARDLSAGHVILVDDRPWEITEKRVDTMVSSRASQPKITLSLVNLFNKAHRNPVVARATDKMKCVTVARVRYTIIGLYGSDLEHIHLRKQSPNPEKATQRRFRMPAKWSDEIAPFLTLCDEEGGWGGERKAAGSPNCSITMLMLEAVGRFQLLAFGIGDWESLG